MNMADIATTLRKVTGVREWNKRKRAESLAGVAFTSPWTIGLILFLASLYYSFTRHDLPKPPRWVGVANYVKLFTRDRFFPQALWNSFYLTAFGIPSQLLIGLICALLLNPGDQPARAIMSLQWGQSDEHQEEEHQMDVPARRIKCVYMDDFAPHRFYGVHIASDQPVAVHKLRAVFWTDRPVLMAFWSVPGVPGPLA